jgi:serine/threonine protein kinase/Tol biopolymer transport system component
MSERGDQWSEFLSTPVEALAANVMQDMWIGRRFGSYEIVARLGAGGMGEVYRARDTRLGRDVAVKVLPIAVSADRERLARFDREARVLAALNDPHIAAIYGIEDLSPAAEPGRSATGLVLELIDGETLAEWIARGALPIVEAIGIAKQIAEGLEAAHDRGIIHRDLKPSNIALTKSGIVKLLDFGLAKPPVAFETATIDPLSGLASADGALLGTVPYMSPEQARGQPVDKRTDIWAFGCVLFEMLTSRRPFGGDTTSDQLAAILEREPDWSALPAATPTHVRRLLQRCLEKDLKRRLHDIADARIELDEPLSASEPVIGSNTGRGVHPRTLIVGVALAGVGGALAMWSTAPPTTRDRSVVRYTITAPSSLPLLGDVRVAPDGSFLVYSSGGRLVLRRFDRIDAAPIAGTSNAYGPFISPDSRWVGYVDNFTLKKVAVTGGAPITIAQLPGLPIGPTWLNDDTIIVATNNGTTGLLRVPVGGAESSVLTTVDRAHGERGHLFPSVLPGGHAILFTIAADQPANAQIAIVDLDSGQRSTLVRGGSDARYVPSGHLVFAGAGGLSAIRFDLRRRTVVGDPVSPLEHVAIAGEGKANMSLTESGTLVYLQSAATDTAGFTLVWVDRDGHEEPIAAPPRAYVGPRISPDGTRIAVESRDQENDIWLWDLARQALTRLTFDPAIDRDPVWTPDGRHIIFASSRTGAFDLYARAADGTGTDVRLTASTNSEYATQVTPDGLFVIGYEVRPRTAFDVVRFALNGSPGAGGAVTRSELLIETTADDRNAELSPNGRYLAYQSNDSGQFEVYVRPYPQVGGGRWQVSTSFGKAPAWARNGRELFYMDRTNHLMAVPVDTQGATFSAGAAVAVLQTPYATPFAWRMYDVSADGTRFLMIKDRFSQTAAPTIVVAQNWIEELKRILPPN